MIKFKDYKNIRKQLIEKVPAEIWTNPNIKIIDPQMERCEILKECFNFLELGLRDAIPDRRRRNTIRYTHIWEHVIFGVTDDRMKLAFGRGSAMQRSFTSYHREILPHLEYGDSKTFDFWNLRFDVMISFNPTRENELLKENGICIKIIG